MKLSWHPYAERFPLLEGDEYRAFKESIAASGGPLMPVTYRQANGARQYLDGRNRVRACQELGLNFPVKAVSIKDEEKVKAYIRACNIHRRHLTPDLLHALALDLRQEGKSTRQIAEELGVSQSTAARAVNGAPAKTSSPGESSDSPETAPPPLVQGRDGKRYQAKVPPKRHVEPKPGEPLWDWKLFNSGLTILMQRIDVLGNQHNAKETPAAEGLRRQLMEFKGAFEAWHKHLTHKR